jgi:hypothetical protein
MKLKITGIRDHGDLNKERVVMKAESNGDVGDFVLIQSGYRDESVTNGVYVTYWFPDKQFNAGDIVVLYTKSGKSSEKPFKNGTSHFFYLGRSQPIWQEDNRAAVLMYAPEWESFKPE